MGAPSFRLLCERVGVNAEAMWLSPRRILSNGVDMTSGVDELNSSFSGFVGVDGALQVMIGGDLLAQNTDQTQGTAQDQTTGRQPDGSYKAPTGPGSEIAEINDPNGPPSQLIGNGQCVTATSHFSGVTGDTSQWTPGKPAVQLTDSDKGALSLTWDDPARFDGVVYGSGKMLPPLGCLISRGFTCPLAITPVGCEQPGGSCATFCCTTESIREEEDSRLQFAEGMPSLLKAIQRLRPR